MDEVTKFLERCMLEEDAAYLTRTLPKDAEIQNEGGAWSNEASVVVLENGQLSLEILNRLKELRQAEAEAPPRGVYVILPPDFEHLRDEIEPQLLDVGVHVVPIDALDEQKKPRGPIVIGAGTSPKLLAALAPSMLSGWNEKDVSGYEISEPNIGHNFGPTPMRRGGNNKPWYDPEVKKRRAKIAKQSKRKNRK